jgi:hypothetical protein
MSSVRLDTPLLPIRQIEMSSKRTIASPRIRRSKPGGGKEQSGRGVNHLLPSPGCQYISKCQWLATTNNIHTVQVSRRSISHVRHVHHDSTYRGRDRNRSQIENRRHPQVYQIVVIETPDPVADPRKPFVPPDDAIQSTNLWTR